jgi:hypothetical protein
MSDNSDEPRFAVYVIVIEDTETAFQQMCDLPLADWRLVDDNLTEADAKADAIELAATCS